MTLLTMMLIKNRNAEQSIRLYRTIADLPMWNWEQIKRTNDLRYLLRLDDYDVLPELEVDADVWNKLQDEFRERCGESGATNYHTDKVIDLYKLKRDAAIYECDEYNSKLSKTKIKIKLLEGEIESIPINKQTLEDQAVMLEVFFNAPPNSFNPKIISVLWWHKYLDQYEKRTNELANSPKSTV